MTHPIILVCGQLCTEILWQEQLPALATIADTHIAVPRDHETIGAIAQGILAGAPARFALVAHAMGGFVAFEILRRAPERVEKLALMSTLAPADTPKQTVRREGYLRLVEQGRFNEVIEERILMLVHPARTGDRALTGKLRRMAHETGPDTFLRQQRAIMSRQDSRPDLAAIGCPTLIVFARQDGIATMEHQLEMANGIGSARLEIIEDCGHMMTLERPQDVTSLLAGFLSV
jgi:pimeloyl-ACP methyl ester carboxylesterase